MSNSLIANWPERLKRNLNEEELFRYGEPITIINLASVMEKEYNYGYRAGKADGYELGEAVETEWCPKCGKA